MNPFRRKRQGVPVWTGATIAPERAAPVLPEREKRYDDTNRGGGFIVIVYDNDHNTMEEVTQILQAATGCSLDEAEMETWEVHHLGKSVVHHGHQEDCEKVASIIRTIGIRVEVIEE